jgi:hypothetical protein
MKILGLSGVNENIRVARQLNRVVAAHHQSMSAARSAVYMSGCGGTATDKTPTDTQTRNKGFDGVGDAAIPKTTSKGDTESNERRRLHSPLSCASPSWSWAIPKINLPSYSPKPPPCPLTGHPPPSLPNLTAPPFNPLADAPLLPCLLPMSRPLFVSPS